MSIRKQYDTDLESLKESLTGDHAMNGSLTDAGNIIEYSHGRNHDRMIIPAAIKNIE